MRHLFIVNPVAGGSDKTSLVRQTVEKAFSGRSEPYEIYVTESPMDAESKIAQIAESGEHIRVYACGGDGTFNECVCGAALRDNVAVCPYPTGTGNDFCRMFGEEGELFRDLDALLDGEEHPIDLIKCNGRWCANICSVGIDARIGTDVHKYSRLPVIGGSAAYVVSTVINVFKGIASEMKVRCGDYKASGKHTLVCACNGRFYGGGFNPSLDARPDDGELDILIVKGIGLIRLAMFIGKYASGRVDEIKNGLVQHFRGTELELELDKSEVVNVDGEALYGDRISMRLVRSAAKLIVPKGMTFFSNDSPC